MSLENTINSEIKAAMLEKNKKKLEALRAIKSAILLAKTDKGGNSEIAEETEMKILQKLVKQRKDSAELYKSQGRNDLAVEEEYQLSVIEKFLPEQMSDADIRNIVEGIITETGANSLKDMGKIMGLSTKQLSGKADNKIIASIVKELLS